MDRSSFDILVLHTLPHHGKHSPREEPLSPSLTIKRAIARHSLWGAGPPEQASSLLSTSSRASSITNVLLDACDGEAGTGSTSLTIWCARLGHGIWAGTCNGVRAFDATYTCTGRAAVVNESGGARVGGVGDL